jgi:CO/xanthine dehydrogenase FAD-binding subunit
MVRQRELAGIPLVELAMPFVGHYVTRNRGTVGGSIAHADASAELPLCLLVLGGSVHTSSGRDLPADEFFVSHFTTALEDDELLVETSWPEAEAVGFAEFALRHGDFALSACACSLALHEGTITDARVGVGAVVDRPQLLELDLVGAPATPETAREAGARATTLVDPFGNQHVSAAYLRSLTGVVVERALTQAFERTAA